jgi:hypothetical protein
MSRTVLENAYRNEQSKFPVSILKVGTASCLMSLEPLRRPKEKKIKPFPGKTKKCKCCKCCK